MSDLGFHNELVREARALHQKKHRQEQRCFLIEGPDLLRAALATRSKIERVFAIHDALTSDLTSALESANVEIHRVDRRTIDSLSQAQTSQGIVAAVHFLHHQPTELKTILPSGTACVLLVLPSLSDPGNAGTLVRTAEAFGASAACFGERAVEPYNDKLVRASAGSIFRLPIVIFESWEGFAKLVRAERVTIVGTAADGIDVRTVTLPQRAAVVIGQERRGLTEIPRSDIDVVVSIPQARGVESLNAAIAGALVLYEFERALGTVRGRAGTTRAQMSSP